MQFTHTTDNRLAGFRIIFTFKRGVFLAQRSQSLTQFVSFGGRYRFNRHADNRLGECNRLQHISSLLSHRVSPVQVYLQTPGLQQ